MKKVSKKSNADQFANQTLSKADTKKVKGGNEGEIVIVDTIMERVEEQIS